METFNNYDLHFKFLPRFDYINFPNMEYIHPLKQLDMYYILEAWKNDDNIKKVVVFGSAVSDRCHSGSDIDLYLELKDNEKPPKLPYDKITSEVDMIIHVKPTDSIWKAIASEGIVVRFE